MAEGQRFGQLAVVRAKLAGRHGHGDDRHDAVVPRTRAAHDRHVTAAHPQIRRGSGDFLDLVRQRAVPVVLRKGASDARLLRPGMVEDRHVHPRAFEHLPHDGVVDAEREVPQLLKMHGRKLIRPVRAAALRFQRLIDEDRPVRHKPFDMVVLAGHRAGDGMPAARKRHPRPHGRRALYDLFRHFSGINEGLRLFHSVRRDVLKRHQPLVGVAAERAEHARQRQPPQAVRPRDAHGTPVLIDGYGHLQPDAFRLRGKVAGGDGGGIGNGPRLGAADGGLYFTLKKSIQIHDSSKWRETICLPLFKKRSNPLRALPCRFPRAKKVRLLFSHFTPVFFSYG